MTSKISSFVVTIKHNGEYAPKWMKQDIKSMLRDLDEVKAVTISEAPLKDMIKALGDSTRQLRMLRQYASHIRNQVIMHYKSLAKSNITYIDLDTLDEISVTCMQNCEAMKKAGVHPGALQHYLRRQA